jgi:hypothetical protein
MTSEKRHLVEMGDIRSIEIACRNSKCGSSVSVGILADLTPQNCPGCNDPLFEMDTKRQLQSVNDFRMAVRELLSVSNVRLDINEISST